jgi:DNA-binding HxlR family transcriptional regulator
LHFASSQNNSISTTCKSQVVRYNNKMHSSKTITRSPCAISNVLDILGDRWTLLVVRDLLFYGKHEFKEFLSSPESIATNILTQRLQRLCAADMIDDIAHPDNRSRKLYYLTDKGKALLPVLIEMVIWAEEYLPESEIMKPIQKALKQDSQGAKLKVFSRLKKWEDEYLPKSKRA